jgi:hypothetical protein
MRTHPNADPQKSAALQKPVVPVLSATLAIPGGPTPAASEAELAAAQAADKNQEPGVEVNISDSAQTGVSVFYLPGSDVASASAVVWIDDTAGGKE